MTLRKLALEDRSYKTPGVEYSASAERTSGNLVLPHTGNSNVQSAGEDFGGIVVLLQVGGDSGEQHNGKLLPHLDQVHRGHIHRDQGSSDAT